MSGRIIINRTNRLAYMNKTTLKRTHLYMKYGTSSGIFRIQSDGLAFEYIT